MDFSNYCQLKELRCNMYQTYKKMEKSIFKYVGTKNI